MVNVVNKIVVPGRPAVDNGIAYAPFKQVHLHSTGNTKSTMQNEVDFLARNWQNAYYTHLVGIDENGNAAAWQVAQTNGGAYDVGGDWNWEGYAAIEFAERIETQEQFNAAYAVYVELARQLAHEAGVTDFTLDTVDLAGIKTHNYASKTGHGSDHVDPLPFLAKWGVSYDQFKKDIVGGGSVKPTPTQTATSNTQQAPANDVQYMKQYGYVVWNGKDFHVDDRGYINGMWQVISNELGGLQPTPTTSATEWTNNGVPMSAVDWTDGTDQSSTNGGRFKFKQDHMDIVDYDEPSNGIAVNINGFPVWVDASVARNA